MYLLLYRQRCLTYAHGTKNLLDTLFALVSRRLVFGKVYLSIYRTLYGGLRLEY